MGEREPMRRDGSGMDLPPGKTCADCTHFRRCNLMFGHIAADESCDWLPSRFRAAPLPPSPEGPTEEPK
jgi:hypothetical protein